MVPDVLVVYVFSNTDPEYINNLRFFLREGVNQNDGCEYLIVVNDSKSLNVRSHVLQAAERHH